MTTTCEQHKRCAAVFLGVLATGLFGCSQGSSHETDSFVQRDSSGIQITKSSAPLWSETEVWVLDSVPSVRIGGEVEDSVPLYGVERARLLADGRIVVALARTKQVLMFAASGDFERVVGGPGEGPGEFTRVDDMYKCAGDTVVVNDFYRESFFNAEGEHVRTKNVKQGGGRIGWIEGITADCSTWLVKTHPQEVPHLGTIGTQHATLMWSPVDQSSRDTFATVPVRNVYNRIYPGWENHNLLISVPWTDLSTLTVGDSRAYVGISDRPEVRVFDTSGVLVQIIRWAESADPVSRSDRQLYEKKRERLLPVNPLYREVLPPLGEFPEIPHSKPLFRTLLTDDEGNLWVRAYPVYVAGLPHLHDFGGEVWVGQNVSDEDDAWKVFDEQGRLLGAVKIPAGLHVLAIERGYVITVAMDELDIETVELYRLDKRTGPRSATM